MGFLDRAIKRAVSNAVGDAVEQGVKKAVEPKIEQAAANAVNRTAQSINQPAGQPQQTVQPQSTVNQAEVQQAANTLGGLFGGLTGAATDFANQAAKNMKICPSCGEGAGKDVKFCPKCGAKLPEETVAQGAVCPSCGKQNSVGTKFCQDCGTKLPSAVAEEQAVQSKKDATLNRWDTVLPEYPKWNGGGNEIGLEQEDGYTRFYVTFNRGYNAENEVRQYRDILRQNGFHPAGQYMDVCHFYNKINGVCYHVDTEHCFDGGQDHVEIYFNIDEPTGGYDYVKPEPKKNSSIFDLFK